MGDIDLEPSVNVIKARQYFEKGQGYSRWQFTDANNNKREIFFRPFEKSKLLSNEFTDIQNVVAGLIERTPRSDETTVSKRDALVRSSVVNNWEEIADRFYPETPEHILNHFGRLTYEDVRFNSGLIDMVALGPDGTIFIFDIKKSINPKEIRFQDQTETIKRELGGKIPVVRYSVNNFNDYTNDQIVFTPITPSPV